MWWVLFYLVFENCGCTVKKRPWLLTGDSVLVGLTYLGICWEAAKKHMLLLRGHMQSRQNNMWLQFHKYAHSFHFCRILIKQIVIVNVICVAWIILWETNLPLSFRISQGEISTIDVIVNSWTIALCCSALLYRSCLSV